MRLLRTNPRTQARHVTNLWIGISRPTRRKNVMKRSPVRFSILQLSIFCVSLLALSAHRYELQCVAAEEGVKKSQDEQLEPARKEQLLLRVERLEKILAEAENKVRKKRNELSGLADRIGSADSPTLNRAQQTSLEQIGVLRREISKIRLKRTMAEAKLEAREKLQKSNEDEASISKRKLKIETWVKQESQLAEELEQLTKDARKYGRASIDVEMMRKDIDLLDPVVAKLSQEIERSKLELQKFEK